MLSATISSRISRLDSRTTARTRTVSTFKYEHVTLAIRSRLLCSYACFLLCLFFTRNQFVDMRWGIPSIASEYHDTTDLCLKEIVNCRKVSVGPNFIVCALLIACFFVVVVKKRNDLNFVCVAIGSDGSKVRLASAADGH